MTSDFLFAKNWRAEIYWHVDKWIYYKNIADEFWYLIRAGIIVHAAESWKNFFGRRLSVNNKSEVQAALTENFPVGTSRALQSDLYGDILIVSTGIAGNLILYKNFYPAAYIRPETLTAVVNAEEPFPPNDDFYKLQQLLKETCKTIIECYSVDELIEFVDMNQDFR